LNIIAPPASCREKEDIKSFLSKLLEDTTDPTFAAFLADELISFKEETGPGTASGRRAFEDGKSDTRCNR